MFPFTLKILYLPPTDYIPLLNKKDSHHSITYFPYFRQISKHNDRELNIPYSRRNLYSLESTFSKNFATIYFRENMYFRFERISKGKSRKKSTQNPLYSVWFIISLQYAKYESCRKVNKKNSYISTRSVNEGLICSLIIDNTQICPMVLRIYGVHLATDYHQGIRWQTTSNSYCAVVTRRI